MLIIKNADLALGDYAECTKSACALVKSCDNMRDLCCSKNAR